MKKNRIYTYIVIIALVTVFLGTSSNTLASSEIPYEIRIGLRQLYEDKSYIGIYNSKLMIGYEIKSDWISEMTLESHNKYYIKPLTGYYLVSQQLYYEYDEIKEVCESLQKKGFKAYPGSQSSRTWRIFVGSFGNQSSAQSCRDNINGAISDISFSVESDNKKRMKVESSSSETLIVLDSTYERAQFVVLSNKGIIDLGDRQYRGKMEFYRDGSDTITAINILPVKDYLYGVLPGEVGSSWHMEALKAQAVAARNYALYHVVEAPKYSNKPYDLCDTTSSQVYKGWGIENERTNQAVDETAGRLLYYKDKLVHTFFFSTSGGQTENSENVWVGNVPYLKAVPDIYETPERKPWIKILTADEIKQKLKAHDINIGNIQDIEVTSYSNSGRAMSVLVVGDQGVKEIKKETMRIWLGLYSRKFELIKKDYVPRVSMESAGGNFRADTNLKDLYVVGADGKVKKTEFHDNQVITISSTNLKNYSDLSSEDGIFIFAGMGWGHGVGLSQSGAKGMAEAGFTYEEILTHYYSNTELR